MPTPGGYFESLVFADPRPYKTRAPSAQKRVAALLAALGNPHLRIPAIHICGSKGKGSVALYCEAILHANGKRVATFTSPHLERWTERFRIDSRESLAHELEDAVARIKPIVTRLRAQFPDDPPTFFDALTACAFLMFDTANVDYAVVEAGLGARLDATRIADTRVACVTSIELEHTEKLGSTLAEIATEKAGVIRRDRPLVCGPLPVSARRVVDEHASALGAPVYHLGEAFEVSIDGSKRATFRNSHRAFSIPVAPPVKHVANNMAVAIQCCELLLGPASCAEQSIVAGLGAARLPGRTEVLDVSPLIIVDGAHTAAAGQALMDVLRTYRYDALHVVLSATYGKKLEVLLAPLLSRAHSVTATSAVASRSMTALDLSRALTTAHPDLPVTIIEDPNEAILKTRRGLGINDAMVVTGSVYLAGRGRGLLIPEAARRHDR